MSLAQRVALVTGASQGIGRTCALRFAKEGAAVAVAARNQEKLNELLHEITAAGGKAADLGRTKRSPAYNSGFQRIHHLHGELECRLLNVSPWSPERLKALGAHARFVSPKKGPQWRWLRAIRRS